MAKTEDYQALQQRLNEIMQQLQREEVSVDEAIKLYEEGLKTVQKLEQFLGEAAIRLRDIKARFEQ